MPSNRWAQQRQNREFREKPPVVDMKYLRVSRYMLLPLIFLGVVIALNYRAFTAPFYYDSIFFLVEQSHRYAAGDFWGVISLFPQRPMAMMSFYLSYLLGGMNPYYFRLFNAVLMALAGFMVSLIAGLVLETPALKTTTSETEKHVLSALLGLIFVVHPIQSFVVLYVWQRAALLCCLFYLSALAAYLAARTNRIPATWGFFVSFVFFLLAMASKEHAITLPAVVLLSEIAFFNTEFKKLVKTAGLIGGVMVFVVAVMSLVERPHGSDAQVSGIMATVSRYYAESGLTLTQVLINQCRIVFSYILLIIDPEPFRLQLITPQIVTQSVGQSVGAAGAVLAAAVLGGAGIALLRVRPLAGFGILFFIAGLLPESVLVPQYLFITYRASLPMFGALLVLADIVCLILQRARKLQGGEVLRVSAIAGLLVIVVVLSAITRSKAEDWRDPVLFWKKVVEQLPPLGENIEKEGTRQALNHLGFSLSKAGRSAEALEWHRKALTLSTGNDRTYAFMANAYIAMGDLAQAEAAYGKALGISPRNAEAHAALGGLLSQRGQNLEAAKHYRTAVEVMPNMPNYRYALAVVLVRLKNYGEAISHFRAAVQLNPNFAEARYQLGKALLETGKSGEAFAEFHRVLILNPGHAAAHTDLGVMLANAGRIQEAAPHFREALKANPNDELAKANLKTALQQMREMSGDQDR